MKTRLLIVAILGIALFSFNADLASAGSKHSYGSQVTDDSTDTKDEHGCVRDVIVTIDHGTDTPLKKRARRYNFRLEYVQAMNAINPGDFVVADTAVTGDTHPWRYRAASATVDSGATSRERVILALGYDTCATNTNCWVMIRGFVQNGLYGRGGANNGDLLTLTSDATFVAAVQQVNNNNGDTPSWSAHGATLRALETRTAGQRGYIGIWR